MLVVLLISASLVWWPSTDFVPARTDKFAFAVPEKPSIAVTPFVNLGTHHDTDWLSTGLSTAVITALSASPDMVVISQNALDDMGEAEPGEIAERYGVRYVLDGTAQSDGTNLRVSARLADAIAGRILWSGQWDRTLDEVFAIQDDIADAIFEELQVRLTIGEQARIWREYAGTAENMRDLVVGRGAFQTFTPEDHEVVARLWNSIYERSPELPTAMSLQGWLHWHKVIVGLSTNPVADLEAAQDWALKAIEAGLGGQPHVLYASAANMLGQRQNAIEYAELGLQAAPGEADVIQIAGFVLSENGRLQEGIALMERGMRLEPDYPEWLAGAMVNALMKAGRRKEAQTLALDMLTMGVRAENAHFSALISLVVLSVWDREPGLARQYMTELLALRPRLTVKEIRRNPRYASFGAFDLNPGYGERYIAALSSAGLPQGE